MRRLITTLGVLSVLAGAPAAAQSFEEDKGLAALLNSRAAVTGVSKRDSDTHINNLQRMRDDGLPDHWYQPPTNYVVEEAPPPRESDPFARSHLLDGVSFRSDGDLGDRLADQYGGFSRSLSTRVLGEKRGENVRFKRVDDGVGISIKFD